MIQLKANLNYLRAKIA